MSTWYWSLSIAECKSSPLLFSFSSSFPPHWSLDRSSRTVHSSLPSTNPSSTDYNQSPLNMGQYPSKPENPHIRVRLLYPPSIISISLIQDRIRLCDGLNPLFGSTVAAAGNGRYVFILGDKSVPYPCPWSPCRNPERFRSNDDPTAQIALRSDWITSICCAQRESICRLP